MSWFWPKKAPVVKPKTMGSVIIAAELAEFGFPEDHLYRDEVVAIHSYDWLKNTHGPKVKAAVNILKWRDSSWDCDKAAFRSFDIANEYWGRRAVELGMFCGHSLYPAWIQIAIGCEDLYWQALGINGDSGIVIKPQSHYTVICRCDDGQWYLQEPFVAKQAPLKRFFDENNDLGLKIISKSRFVQK